MTNTLTILIYSKLLKLEFILTPTNINGLFFMVSRSVIIVSMVTPHALSLRRTYYSNNYYINVLFNTCTNN